MIFDQLSIKRTPHKTYRKRFFANLVENLSIDSSYCVDKRSWWAHNLKMDSFSDIVGRSLFSEIFHNNS